MPVVDTSFLVASWNADHPHHQRARAQLDSAISQGAEIAVNAGAVAEASRVIRRLAKDHGKDGNRAARAFLDVFMHLPGARIETSHANDAWIRYLGATALSYVDAWVAEQAERAGDVAWTFDRAIRRRGR